MAVGYSMLLYCTACKGEVNARLTDGSECYSHRPDLHHLPFWKCPVCANFVGCHHKTDDPTRPLGHIPSPEIKEARKHIHKILDPIWKSGKISRTQVYKQLTKKLGWQYHTACIRSIDEARDVYRAVRELGNDLSNNPGSKTQADQSRQMESATMRTRISCLC